jgi:hypothetical protein
MVRPMQGSVNVNAGLAGDQPYDADSEFSVSEPPSTPVAGDLGPCLYLGPAGQRCSRRAVEGGFCARHQPDGSQVLSIPQVSRRTVALLGLLAVLWPVLADLIRELMRLLR